MLFNSIDFAVFLPLIFFLYWYVTQKRLVHQNILIVLASYVFYGWWDWRFLSLILFSTLVDFLVGIGLEKQTNPTKRKVLLWTSILINLGFLGFFKYYNFFIDNFITAFTFFGAPLSINSLQIVLPVGISFYTFQTLSYSIDVYHKKLKPTKDFIAFTAFVSFFPQLVAGPIERATNLLPQFYQKREFSYDKAVDGCRQILWGLFKKVVIADNCAVLANRIFDNYESYHGSTLFLAALFFAFQIYGDFSGYSDIAIGTSRLFGISLMQNFAYPYFSRDIAEFWRRWHISLSTWFRDYVYIPLGGNQGTTAKKINNIFIIFVVSGFWHGANWTFIVWGLLNALYFIPLLLLKQNRIHTDIAAKDSILPTIKELFQIGSTFLLTLLAWVFFRSASVPHAINYLSIVFSKSFFSIPQFQHQQLIIIPFIFLLIIAEWINRNNQHALHLKGWVLPKRTRWMIYYGLILIIVLYGGSQQNFIYFQF